MRTGKAGFTLIEILISIGLFLLLMGMVTPTILMSFRVNRDAQNNQSINAYAKSAIDVAEKALLQQDTSATSTDKYPNLKTGTIPTGTVFPDRPTGLNCTIPEVVGVPRTYNFQGKTLGSRVTVRVSCTPPNRNRMDFVKEVGRPS